MMWWLTVGVFSCLICSQAMANDFLISKWKTWFSWFDHKRDGKVGVSDLMTARSNFIQFRHMEGEEKRQFWDTFTKWWYEYVLWGKEEITEAEFLEKQNDAFKADKTKFIERTRKCEEIICPLVDTAHHGFFTEEDMVMICKADGHRNKELNKHFFAALEPVDGKISIQRMIDMWIQYLSCDDESQPDNLVNAFAGGI